MIVWKTLRTALRSIMHTPLRSFLTILGVVIGIAAVISLVGLGRGLQQQVTGRISDLGATRLTVSSVDPERPTAQRGRGGRASFRNQDRPTLTAGDYTAIASLPGVAAATPDDLQQIDVASDAGARTAAAYQLRGVDVAWTALSSANVAAGSFLTAEQVQAKQLVVVLGARAATELFARSDPVGKKITVGGRSMTVVGVLGSDGRRNPRTSVDGQIFTPWTSWLSLTGRPALSTLTVRAVDEDAVAGVQSDANQVLSQRHQVGPSGNPDFSVTSATDLLRARTEVTAGFSAALTGIAAISLLVGGIGIMNIMLVTVTERTREIGLRRAVGAKSRHILGQFLTEAVVLTGLGGLAGLALGYLLGKRLGTWLPALTGAGGSRNAGRPIEASFDPQIAILAIGISVLVGLVFGLSPAIRAARMDTATALRHE